MIYLIAAYGVVWLITFGFVATVFWRQRQLQQQVAWMEQLLETETKARQSD
ncbi:MAG: CcmD family protein [Anaerolineae bacterium]|nr:CcmD family protein [Anaerolineae bacterium]MDW8072474.1 CcmD family protein [Anaerolineae bacterium]